MARKKKLYVVTMYRYGDVNNDSYVLGVFSTKTKATKHMEGEQLNRGGEKYKGEILEYTSKIYQGQVKR